jgi:hypothetical protein
VQIAIREDFLGWPTNLYKSIPLGLPGPVADEDCDDLARTDADCVTEDMKNQR